MKLHKILDKLLNLNNLKKFLNSILINYEIFDNISKLKYVINKSDFNEDLYNDSDNEDNLILMFKLLEKKFYKIIKNETSKILNFKDEISNNTSSNKFYLIICDNQIKINIFKVFLLFYYTNVKILNKESYIGLDLEFNTKVAALIQLNFNMIDDLFNENMIFIIEPDIFKKNWRKFFINYILCRKNIYKILHGSDSLDIPYIYNTLLESDINLILKFTKYFIDTKFLCEYSNYKKFNEIGKCKIYYILLNENIISKNKFNELLQNEENMGPIYDITININKMNKNLIDYTLYDVIYLYEVIKCYKNKLDNFHLINELSRASIINKRNDFNIIPIDELNKINNYIFDKSNEKVKLIDQFNLNFERFLNKYKDLQILLKINYLKSLIINVFKYESYYNICKKYDVYSKLKGQELYDNKILDIDINYSMFYKFKKYLKFFNKYKD